MALVVPKGPNRTLGREFHNVFTSRDIFSISHKDADKPCGRFGKGVDHSADGFSPFKFAHPARTFIRCSTNSHDIPDTAIHGTKHTSSSTLRTTPLATTPADGLRRATLSRRRVRPVLNDRDSKQHQEKTYACSHLTRTLN